MFASDNKPALETSRSYVKTIIQGFKREINIGFNLPCINGLFYNHNAMFANEIKSTFFKCLFSENDFSK